MDWFGRDRIREAAVTLYLIGVNPTAQMMREADKRENIIVTGEVADLKEYYRPVDTLFVAPLLAGGGVKRKVIEAMARGCPVITTDVGAEGLALDDGRTAEVCRIEEFPERILQLVADRKKRILLAMMAQKYINENFGYMTLQAAVRNSFESLELIPKE
jgi:glycosyltransferase involved in cell wall biosynthesis